MIGPCKLCGLDKQIHTKNMCAHCYQAEYYALNRDKVRARINAAKAAKRADPEQHKKMIEEDKKYKRLPKGRYAGAKWRANRKNWTFTLTQEEYLEEVNKPCYYCNGYFPPVEVSIGLDRIDNTKGYEPGNVLSCCATCNHTRNAHFTVEETKKMIELVISLRTSNEL